MDTIASPSPSPSQLKPLRPDHYNATAHPLSGVGLDLSLRHLIASLQIFSEIPLVGNLYSRHKARTLPRCVHVNLKLPHHIKKAMVPQKMVSQFIPDPELNPAQSLPARINYSFTEIPTQEAYEERCIVRENDEQVCSERPRVTQTARSWYARPHRRAPPRTWERKI